MYFGDTTHVSNRWPLIVQRKRYIQHPTLALPYVTHSITAYLCMCYVCQVKHWHQVSFVPSSQRSDCLMGDRSSQAGIWNKKSICDHDNIVDAVFSFTESSPWRTFEEFKHSGWQLKLNIENTGQRQGQVIPCGDWNFTTLTDDFLSMPFEHWQLKLVSAWNKTDQIN